MQVKIKEGEEDSYLTREHGKDPEKPHPGARAEQPPALHRPRLRSRRPPPVSCCLLRPPWGRRRGEDSLALERSACGAGEPRVCPPRPRLEDGGLGRIYGGLGFTDDERRLHRWCGWGNEGNKGERRNSWRGVEERAEGFFLGGVEEGWAPVRSQFQLDFVDRHLNERL